MTRLLARLWAVLFRPRHDWQDRGCHHWCGRCGAVCNIEGTVIAADGTDVTGTRDAANCP